MSVMRYCVGLIFAMVLLAGCSFGQASTSTLTATPATPVSRPIAVKPTDVNAPDLNSIDLKPDATGVVPPEQIRDLLRRTEEKDLKTKSACATTPTSNARSGTNSTGVAGNLTG